MPVLGTQVIKSVQRGNTSLTPGTNGVGSSVNVTINSVDTDKSFLTINNANSYVMGNVGSSYTTDYVSSSIEIGGWIAGATQLTLVQGSGRAYNDIVRYGGGVYWEVIEYV